MSLKGRYVGSYKVQDILGQGNFSTVYLAVHELLGTKVALKVINRHDIKEEYVSRNLDREARILAQLDHQNIIRYYETIVFNQYYCFSLELVRGVNLCHYLKRQIGNKIPERISRLFFYQMASAVKHMHHSQILHRDLKHENILIEHERVVKIVDFGLSNVYYPCYRLRTHCGSVDYAAPELFRNRSVYGKPVDMWSLGVILYSMVIGKMPFAIPKGALDSEPPSRKKELFIRRINKGLTQENWEQMELLSTECWHLLDSLLQPDQFKRLHAEEVLVHPWFTRNPYFNSRLSREPQDLAKKYHHEVVKYLANKLHISKESLAARLKSSNRAAALYFMVRDSLVKDSLYPPRLYEDSFLYHFECWKKVYSHAEQEEIEKYRKLLSKNELSMPYRPYREDNEKTQGADRATDKFILNGRTDDLNPRIEKEFTVESTVQVTSARQNQGRNAMGFRNPQMQQTSVKISKTTNLASGDNQYIAQNRSAFSQPFRSYKANRPTNTKCLRTSQNNTLNEKSDAGEKLETRNMNHNDIAKEAYSNKYITKSINTVDVKPNQIKTLQDAVPEEPHLREAVSDSKEDNDNTSANARKNQSFPKQRSKIPILDIHCQRSREFVRKPRLCNTIHESYKKNNTTEKAQNRN
ncbi:serine/threonine protein kinase OSK1-like [Stegodyphus dumicola]|uniref:serine/threonine protein kinase OSK1-like n=1 Tax=Stegodyphus dumicola TaxID=202533 RepID=UPI0015B224B8|nr:serine/threonine protein kinase OSK1-like [Stegodyphus dumicola]